ncbi:MAG: aminotransferase class IV [Parvularculaceae bacterium]
MIVWRDSEFVEADSAIATSDRGWLIGDAAFETILVESGRAAFLGRHLARLRRAARILDINAEIELLTLKAAVAEVARKNEIAGRAACRITLSRVGGARGLAPSPAAKAQIVVSIAPSAAPAERPMRLIVSTRRRWTGAATNAFKCAGAYAENMLARAEAAAAGAHEAVMLNEFSRVACLSAANIFVIREGRIETPAESEGALPGVVRGVLLEEAVRLGLSPRETQIAPEDLSGAALLATNSIAGAVRSVFDGADVAAESKLADKLLKAYEDRLASEFSAASPEGAA